ncbi:MULTISPECIES: hypothetical protein [Rhodococcus]|uniref:hypothetical protein n=1 Tax=Rhodococcus TaxID=1827 RepID=UPI00193B62E6|nr:MULTISPECIES: hypothetical protein [Rhodococcus]QRI74707.1 hypothetical protein JQ505_19265 [Rhodococcus aetherivorans]QSE58118.1 hypothetical protein JYA75_20375 [Rhodococcus sp. PSBB066]
MTAYPLLPLGSVVIPTTADLALLHYNDAGDQYRCYSVVAMASIPEAGGVRVVPLVVKGYRIVRADEVGRPDRCLLAADGLPAPARIAPATRTGAAS